MAIEVKLNAGRVEADAVLPRTARINLMLRRRRLRRLQQALGMAAWVGGSAALLFFVAASILRLY